MCVFAGYITLSESKQILRQSEKLQMARFKEGVLVSDSLDQNERQNCVRRKCVGAF